MRSLCSSPTWITWRFVALRLLNRFDSGVCVCVCDAVVSIVIILSPLFTSLLGSCHLLLQTSQICLQVLLCQGSGRTLEAGRAAGRVGGCRTHGRESLEECRDVSA